MLLKILDRLLRKDQETAQLTKNTGACGSYFNVCIIIVENTHTHGQHSQYGKAVLVIMCLCEYRSCRFLPPLSAGCSLTNQHPCHPREILNKVRSPVRARASYTIVSDSQIIFLCLLSLYQMKPLSVKKPYSCSSFQLSLLEQM